MWALHVVDAILKVVEEDHVGIVLGELFDGLEYHDVQMHACCGGAVLDVKKSLSQSILRLAQILVVLDVKKILSQSMLRLAQILAVLDVKKSLSRSMLRLAQMLAMSFRRCGLVGHGVELVHLIMHGVDDVGGGVIHV
jgi:hypothetical protein